MFQGKARGMAAAAFMAKLPFLVAQYRFSLPGGAAARGKQHSKEFFMHRVLVLGAGKIGSLLSGLLAASGDYQVDLADSNGHAAQSVAAGHKLPSIKAYQVDAA